MSENLERERIVDAGRARTADPRDKIDESIRQVFERFSEEYEDLRERLFADDPDFGVDTVEDQASRCFPTVKDSE